MPNQLEQMIQQKMAMQKANIDAQRANIQQMGQGPKQMDLSPLMALTDTWTGSNFSKSYKAPESQQDIAFKKAQLEQGLNSQEVGLLDSDIQMLAMLDKRKERQDNNKLNLTTLENKRDQEFGKTFQEFSDSGGYANIAGNLDLLKNVSKKLGSKEGSNLVNTAMPKMLRDFTNPESAAAQEDVETVVQQSLKQILGGAFSEKEAKQLIERAYNPRLSAAANKSKVDALINKIEAGAKAKQDSIDYATKHGTLKGFKGKTSFTLKDFDPDQESVETKEYNGKTYKKVGDKWVQQ